MIMDKVNSSVKQYVVIWVFLIIIGFTAGCGNDDNNRQGTGVQEPRVQNPGCSLGCKSPVICIPCTVRIFVCLAI